MTSSIQEVGPPPASIDAEMQPHLQPKEVQDAQGNHEEELPLDSQARDYDVPMAVTKFSPLISGMGEATKGEIIHPNRDATD